MITLKSPCSNWRTPLLKWVSKWMLCCTERVLQFGFLRDQFQCVSFCVFSSSLSLSLLSLVASISMASAHDPLRVFVRLNSILAKSRQNGFNIDVTKQICFSKRLKSTSASIVTADSSVSSDTQKFQKDELDLTFENTKDAYKSKTTWELLRAFLVLKLTTYDYLVENNQRVSISQ